MIELGRHIEILLLNNDCVIVPNLGGFLTHHVEARYDNRDSMFIPPLRTLGFNPQLTMSDPLLAQSYADAYDISYPEAVAMLEREVESVKNQIEQEGQYEFTDLGVLSLSDEGRYEFEPNEAGLLTPMLYGLSSIEMPLLSEVLKHADIPGTISYDTAPIGITSPNPTFQPSLATIMSQVSPSDRHREEKTISIKVSLLRNLAVTAVAAVALILFARPVPAGEDVASASTTSEAGMLSLPSQEASSASESTADLSIVGGLEKMSRMIEESQEEGVIPESGAFTIVLAYSLPLENAKMFLSDIKSKGARKAVLMTYNGENVIAYGSYTERGDAYVQLQELIASGSVESGWIMQVK